MNNNRSDVSNNPSAFAHGFDILAYAKNKTDIRNNKQDGGCDVVFTLLLYLFFDISRSLLRYKRSSRQKPAKTLTEILLSPYWRCYNKQTL